MASDVMSVRLWLPRIKVEGVVVDAPEELVVRVCSTVRRPRCPDCGVLGFPPNRGGLVSWCWLVRSRSGWSCRGCCGVVGCCTSR